MLTVQFDRDMGREKTPTPESGFNAVVGDSSNILEEGRERDIILLEGCASAGAPVRRTENDASKRARILTFNQAPLALDVTGGGCEIDVPSRIQIEPVAGRQRSEEHTSELQSLMRISYAVFCLKKKKKHV